MTRKLQCIKRHAFEW